MKFKILLNTIAPLILAFAYDQRVLAAPLPSRDPVINLCIPGSFAPTFDQGPSLYTGDILDALKERNVKATFHPVVTFLNEAPIVANLQRAAEEGHLIGLSLEEDFELDGISDDDLLHEINERADIIKQKIGYKPVYLRIPKYKKLSSEQLDKIISKGYIISTYNIDSYDYSKDNILAVYKQILDKMSPNTKGGFISVQRDYLESSAAATGDVIDYVLEKGYKIVSLDQCAKTKVKDAPGPRGPGPIKSRESGAQHASISFFLMMGVLLPVAFLMVGF